MLSGCSFLSELFVQNRTKERLFVTITYKVPATEFAIKARQMDYVPRICNPKPYREDNQKKPLVITHRSDTTVSFYIPPLSTARVESASNREFMRHIRKISYGGNDFSVKRFIAAAKKRGFNYVHRVD